MPVDVGRDDREDDEILKPVHRSLNIMPDVLDFTRLGVSACRVSAMRRFRRDHEPVAAVTRGPAAIVKLDSEPLRFLFMRVPGFRCIFLSFLQFLDFGRITEYQLLLHL